MLSVIILFILWSAHCGATSLTTVRWLTNGVEQKGTLRVTGKGYPPCDPLVVQRSGYFEINSTTNKNYFFWLAESRSQPSKDPVVLWMTGGPGCSSLLALLAENGPCKINSTLGVVNNTFSWNNIATMIYIDQPAGVGFSYSDAGGQDSNETQVGDDMYRFLQAFYKAYPQYLNNPFFVVGESYGGHYAPATAHRIWLGNEHAEGIKIPLQGLGVGNGLTQPEVQYKYYGKLAYDWCKIVKGKPCISKESYDKMQQDLPACISIIHKCNVEGDPSICSQARGACDSQFSPYFATGLNPYDIRIPCEVPGLCYNFTAIGRFLNLAAVQQSLGVVKPIKWVGCNYTVNGEFSGDWMQNFGDNIMPDLLNSNIRVLIYAGDMDWICNWMGNKAWLLEMPWGRQKDFQSATDAPFYIDEVEAGFLRTVGNNQTSMLLSFAQIHGAGHMVPMDQPKRSIQVMHRFFTDTPFPQ